MTTIDELKARAKALGVPNWQTFKKPETLQKAIYDFIEANGKPAEEKTDEQSGNQGFIEAAKEERLYAFADPKGSRIGLYRRIDTETWIKPGNKDSSFQFVRWTNEK